ncbi:MAG: DUF4232 domain-containing protein [Actinomycetota bacterium]|nr:DUF4232 domain-containing protein [Actinomycetota bacterium]
MRDRRRTGRARAALTTLVAASAAIPAAAAVPWRPGVRPSAPAPCRGRQLVGNFSIVRGGEGAGNVVYALELVNRSFATCTLSGLPGMQLLGRAHEALPTHVRLAGAGSATAVLVVLRHGVPAWSSARFSGDVPGAGEPSLGRCERTAYYVRARGAGAASAVLVPVRPPTPVCEHGTMSVSVLSRVRPTA